MANAVAACAPCSCAILSSTQLSQQLRLCSSFRIRSVSSRRVSFRCLRTHAARKSDQLSTGRPAPVPAAAEKKSLIQKVEDPLAQRDYRPPQEGDQPDFWEGAGWDGVGFVLQYLWAFGIAIAILACGYAVRTYNSGASDFTQTETFKSAQEAARPTDGPTTTSTITDDAPPLYSTDPEDSNFWYELATQAKKMQALLWNAPKYFETVHWPTFGSIVRSVITTFVVVALFITVLSSVDRLCAGVLARWGR